MSIDSDIPKGHEGKKTFILYKTKRGYANIITEEEFDDVSELPFIAYLQQEEVEQAAIFPEATPISSEEVSVIAVIRGLSLESAVSLDTSYRVLLQLGEVTREKLLRTLTSAQN